MKLKNIKLSKLIEILIITAGASVMLLALVIWAFDLTSAFNDDYQGDLDSKNAVTVNLDREFSSDKIDLIEADLLFSHIEVRIGNSDVISLNYSGSVISSPEMREPYLNIDQSGNRLTLSPVIGGTYSVRNSTLTLTLTLPEKKLKEMILKTSSGDVSVRGDVSDRLKVDTTSGSASVSGFHGSSLILDSSSGKLSVNDSRTEDISMEASSGDVQVSETETGSFRVDTSSGDIKIDNFASGENRMETTSGTTEIVGLAGNLDFKSSSGSLNADFEEEGEIIKVDTSSGDVTLSFNGDAQFTITADTSSGKFAIDFPLTLQGDWDDDHVEGKVGDGSGIVKISTSSGDISIEKR